MKQRALEIAHYFTSWPGATFPCHKTTVSSEDEDGHSHRVSTEQSQHCVGGVIFALKHDNLNQIVRIAAGLGLLDLDKLQDKDQVFDSLEEMLDAQR